jgi:hypothetical protein
MTNIILIISIGIIAILVILGLRLAVKQIMIELKLVEKLVRRCIELGFWEQRRSRKLLKR